MPIAQLIVHLIVVAGLLTAYVVIDLSGKDPTMIGSLLLGYLGARGIDIGFTAARNGNGKPTQ